MNRRHFLGAAASGALALPSFGFQSPASQSRTNLLLIIVDQLSGLALPYADPHARMPNTGKLTESGVLFSHAYTAGMTCGPSRASLDTGVFTQTHGVGGGFRQTADMPSLTGTLAQFGYVSSHPDGYDLEKERALHEKWLIELGYQQPLSSINGTESLARYLDLPLKWKCGRAGVAPEHGFDVYCAQRAIRFLEVNQDIPFACFLQLRGPHDPYMVPRPFDTLVNPATIQVPPYRTGEFANKPKRTRESFESQGASKMTDDQLRQILGLYYGMSAYSDYAIGLVMNRLRELKLDGDTVVALVSDHGDTMGRHRFVSKDFAFYEPAIRIPMIFRAPGRAAGIVRTDPVSGIDLFPTLCELMGLPMPLNIPGQSLVKRWEGAESDPDRPIFAAQGAPRRNRASMLRTNKFKYARYDDGGSELYDLTKDPDELANLVDAPAYAESLAEMKKQLDDHERRYPHRA